MTQYRAKASMESDINKIKEANKMLSEADKQLTELISSIEGKQFSWEGDNREAAISLLRLCSEFSKKLIPIAEDNCKAMENFYSSAEGFMSSSSIISPWR